MTNTCEEKLRELADEFERLGRAASPSAEVLDIRGKDTLLYVGGAYAEATTKPGIKIGDMVTMVPTTGQIIKKLDIPLVGEIASVVRQIDARTLEISLKGETRIVDSAGVPICEPGQQVILNSSTTRAIRALPAPKPKKLEIPTVSWSDIGGQDKAKHELREAIEYPRTYAKLWKHYNKRIPKGILLWGPVGTGKTMLGKAVATAMNQEFLYVKAPELLNAYVGVTEERFRDLLKQASTGKVLFLDEADAILGERGTRHAFMEKTIVPTFLTEMDGIETFKGTVILATNRPDTLDPAVLRDGRIDRKIEVSRPNSKDTQTIFGIYLKTVPHEGNGKLAELGTELLFDEKLRFPDGKPFHSLVSGALVEGIVDKSISVALARDMKSGKPSQVTRDDLHEGVQESFRQNHAIYRV